MDKPLTVLRHIRNYATGGLISAIIGVVSFPILTRSLSVEDYGVLGLVLSTLTLFVAVGKFGIQHSIIRFYAEVKNNNSEFTKNQFYTTTLMLGLLLGVVAMIFCLVVGYSFAPIVAGSETISIYFLIGTLYIFFRMLSSNMCNVLSAQLKSGVVMVSVVVRRFTYLAVILIYAFTNLLSVAMVVGAFVIAELISLVYVARHYLPGKSHILKGVSSKLASVLLWYGVPLMMLESLGLMMRLSDRYIIQYLLDDNALGQYAASYNLVGYIEIMITVAIISAVKPIYTEIWESKGKQPTQEFLADGLHIYLMLGIPFVVLVSLTAPHVINILASSKYEAGTVVIPWVTLAILFEGALLFLAAGIYLRKETKKLVFWSFIAVIINIVLNFLFIPKYGIVGASVVTVITFAFYVLGIKWSAFKLLDFDIDLRNPILITLASIVVYFAVKWLPIEFDLLAILVKGSIAGIILAVTTYMLDGKVRLAVNEQMVRIAGRLGDPWGIRLAGFFDK